MDRRTFLRGAVIAASTPAAVGIVAYDPILTLIQDYRDALQRFNEIAPDNNDDEWDRIADEHTFPISTPSASGIAPSIRWKALSLR